MVLQDDLDILVLLELQMEVLSFPIIIIMHPILTRSTILIDNSPFENSFTEYDPGTTPFGQGEAIWPKLAIIANDDIVIFYIYS